VTCNQKESSDVIEVMQYETIKCSFTVISPEKIFLNLNFSDEKSLRVIEGLSKLNLIIEK